MFYSDKPISTNSDDLLKRSGFAKLLAETIASLDKADTFTVGVFGKWGSGKTSVVKMMLQELEKQQEQATPDNKIIVVHFEPWNFTDTNQLLNQCFVRLANEFRRKGDKGLKAVGDALEKYSDAFTLAELIPDLGIAGSIISFLGKNGAAAVGKFLKKRVDANDVQSQKEYVINLLKKQTSKILVVIDDIDRLSNEQIRQVFQLVTSVAKFPNTTYLLVFDKDIVVKALEQVQEGNGEDYLEKVIQMPIQIPDIQRSALRQILFNRLDEILKKHTDVNFTESHWQTVYTPCIDPFIKHIRDINRLCNAVEFKLSAISGEVDLTDIVAITALEISMPAVYEWVKENKELLTGNYFDFAAEDKSHEEWYKIYEQQIGMVLSIDQNKETNKREIDTAIGHLVFIFPCFGNIIGKNYEYYTMDELRRNNQIAHPDKFDRYFHLTIDYIVSRKNDVTSAVSIMSSEELCEFLLLRDRENTSYDFLEEVRAASSNIGEERAKVLIVSLFETANYLDGTTEKNTFSLKAQSLAENIIFDLLERIPQTRRHTYLIKLIDSANHNNLSVLATVVNKLELAYGRLATNGRGKRAYHKIVTLEELSDLELTFCNRAKKLIDERSLFQFRKWQIVLHLLESFDIKFTSNYLSKELSQDESVLRYLESSVTKWVGGITTYEINTSYKKHLTSERIMQAIQNQKASGNLFLLPAEVQYACAAFFIAMNDAVSMKHGVSLHETVSVLAQWANSKSNGTPNSTQIKYF